MKIFNKEKREKLYLDYVNNFITFRGWLDYYGLLEEEGIAIIREFKKDLK
jgi:hypothetical protein